MPLTLYRIIDATDDVIVANRLSSHQEAYEVLSMYQQDQPTHTFEIETYTVYTTQGLGRDPDLH